MTREDLLNALIAYAGDDYDSTDPKQVAFLEFTVDDAIEEVVNQMCPWLVVGSDDDETADLVHEMHKTALQRYGNAMRKIAMFHYDKQGKEGVTTFYESGQTTSYKGGGTPSEFLAGIVPIAKII